jgi:hypothetical protein
LKGSGGDEELFCRVEGGIKSRSPGELFRSTFKGISERV